MKKLFYIIGFILLLQLVGLGQADRNRIQIEYQKTQLRIEKLERLLSAIDQPVFLIELNKIKLEFNKIKPMIDQQQFILALAKLKEVNSRIFFILKQLSQSKLFNQKYVRNLELTLNKAEKTVKNSANQEAIYFLQEAYNLKRRGIRILRQEPDRFYQGVELLIMSKRLADNAIQLASNFQNRSDISMKSLESKAKELMRIWERNKNKFRPDENRKIEQQFSEFSRSLDATEYLKAFQILTQIQASLEMGKVQHSSVVKLMNQYQYQQQRVKNLNENEQLAGPSLKILSRIEENLLQIEQSIQHMNFMNAERLLRINHQLLRSIERLAYSSDQADNGKQIILRQFERLQKELEAIADEPGINREVVNNLLMIEEVIDKRIQQGQYLLAGKLLKRSFQLLRALRNKNVIHQLKREGIEKKLRLLEQKVEDMDANDQDKPLYLNLINKIKEKISDNNINAAQQNIKVLEILLEE
ncbi:MAG: hypothetical protein Kow00108_27290 [Calditrichia bacterium]